MLVTDDDAIADRVRLMSLHGISRDAWNRYTAGGSWYYEIEDAGYKYNMTDIAAALGLVQLDRAEELLEARRALVERYRRALRRVSVGRPARAADRRRRRVARLAPVTSSGSTSTGSASTGPPVMDGLAAAGIGASVHFIPLHLHPYYRRWAAGPPTRFPWPRREYERVISLPIWPGMTPDDIGRVVDALDGILSAARR